MALTKFDDVFSPRALNRDATHPRPRAGELEVLKTGGDLGLVNRIADGQRGADVKPLRERGGWGTFPINLATLTTAGLVVVDRAFFGFYIPVQGNPSGVRLEVDFQGAGRKLVVGPGACFKGFTNYAVIRPAQDTLGNAVQSGTLTIMLLEAPDADFVELPDSGGGAGLISTECQVGGATQAYNSAAGNVPTLATEGVPLSGVKGFRVLVAPPGSTISGGNVRLWFYDPTTAAWFPTDTQYGMAGAGLAANRRWSGPDEGVTVPFGRVYAEAVSVTCAVAQANVPVYIQAWG